VVVVVVVLVVVVLNGRGSNGNEGCRIVLVCLVIILEIIKENDSSGFRDVGSCSNSSNKNCFFFRKNFVNNTIYN
jgi:hypothetical protein